MTNIIPAILTNDFNEAKKLLSLFDDKNQWVQLDIMDGKFVNNVSVDLSDDLSLANGMLDIHLMVKNPSLYFADCQKLGAKRVWVHYEAIDDFSDVKQLASQYEINLGLALSPTTDTSVVKEYINDIVGILILGVDPGRQGQGFIPETIDRLKELKQSLPEGFCLAVDGGVNKENIKSIIEAGTTDIIIGSSIVGATNPLEELDYFKSQI
jgi:ribulose-phosphate 3-epimerase